MSTETPETKKEPVAAMGPEPTIRFVVWNPAVLGRLIYHIPAKNAVAWVEHKMGDKRLVGIASKDKTKVVAGQFVPFFLSCQNIEGLAPNHPWARSCPETSKKFGVLPGVVIQAPPAWVFMRYPTRVE